MWECWQPKEGEKSLTNQKGQEGQTKISLNDGGDLLIGLFFANPYEHSFFHFSPPQKVIKLNPQFSILTLFAQR